VDAGVAPLYEGWPRINAILMRRLPALGPDELQLRAGAGGWPIWASIAHLAGARVYWLCGVFKEPGAETTPFPDPLADGWEDRLDIARDPDELLRAVETSWRVVEACLGRWTPDSLAQSAVRRREGIDQVHTRQSVLTRLVMHDAFHCGEVSLILGMHGLPSMDPWNPIT
jgi:uncharacterized damage-inducible protein DinB